MRMGTRVFTTFKGTISDRFRRAADGGSVPPCRDIIPSSFSHSPEAARYAGFRAFFLPGWKLRKGPGELRPRASFMNASSVAGFCRAGDLALAMRSPGGPAAMPPPLAGNKIQREVYTMAWAVPPFLVNQTPVEWNEL